MAEYLWMRLPLLVMFANGYLIYRMLVVTGLAERFVLQSLARNRGDIRQVLLYVSLSAVFLSLFIPNTVTVLTLLPVLKTIQGEFGCRDDRRITTVLTLSVIYGANIGGMGSLIGSPANLLLIGQLDLYQVPGREQIGFFNWFIWSLPLVVTMAIAGWGLLVYGALPLSRAKIQMITRVVKPMGGLRPEHRSGLLLFSAFLLFWMTEAVFFESFPLLKIYEPWVCLSFLVIFIWGLLGNLFGRFGRPLLKAGELVQNVPKRGILFLGLLILLIGMIRIFGLDRISADIFLNIAVPEFFPAGVVFLIALSVIFLTEVFSNTLVSTTFFPIAYFATQSHSIPPLVLMITVSVASTCAFMTPVATPCNALAFGEMRGTSLRGMLILGMGMNLIGAILMSFWLQVAVPWVYG